MSRKNNDYIFPSKTHEKIEAQITQELMKILRNHHHGSSCVKWICRKTGAHERAVRNWYEGKNPPSSGHLIILAQSYPAVLQMILKMTGHGYLIPYIVPLDKVEAVAADPKRGAESDQNVPINVPIKSWPTDINVRQKWFLVELGHTVKVSAASITERWGVTLKTAKRDVSDLKERGLITFNGARKSGHYQLAED